MQGIVWGGKTTWQLTTELSTFCILSIAKSYFMSEMKLQSVNERAGWSLSSHAVRLLVHSQHKVTAGKVGPYIWMAIITLTQCLILLKVIVMQGHNNNKGTHSNCMKLH